MVVRELFQLLLNPIYYTRVGIFTAFVNLCQRFGYLKYLRRKYILALRTKRYIYICTYTFTNLLLYIVLSTYSYHSSNIKIPLLHSKSPLGLCMTTSIENEIRIQQRIIQKRFIHVRKIILSRIYWWLFDRALYVSFYGTWMRSKALRYQSKWVLL